MKYPTITKHIDFDHRLQIAAMVLHTSYLNTLRGPEFDAAGVVSGALGIIDLDDLAQTVAAVIRDIPDRRIACIDYTVYKWAEGVTLPKSGPYGLSWSSVLHSVSTRIPPVYLNDIAHEIMKRERFLINFCAGTTYGFGDPVDYTLDSADYDLWMWRQDADDDDAEMMKGVSSELYYNVLMDMMEVTA